MTNHWSDIRNSDVMLCIGSNPVENHPAAAGHMTEAMDRGAKLISVDPRFTRTSAKADIYAPMRSGTDIAFIGGIIRWVLYDMQDNPGNYNSVYLGAYTNALYRIVSDYKGPVELDGLFSGYAGSQNETDNAKRVYDKASWDYLDNAGRPAAYSSLEEVATTTDSVLYKLGEQFERYDPDTVSAVTGVDKDTFLEICETYAASGAAGKAGTIMYAMGTTQHTNGTQMIRSYVILQLLLANVGVAGGGINALRGESNVQGSTDMCILAHILPGYLKSPLRTNTTLGLDTTQANGIIYGQDDEDANFVALSEADQAAAKASYLWKWTPGNLDPAADAFSLNWWKNYPKYIVSLLKAWYGDNATVANDFCYDYLPKATSWSNHYHIALFESMYAGTIKGLMCWGQNPAVGGPNAEIERKAMENLDWMVAVDLWETETAAFWKRPGVNSTSINTEVILLPAAASYEKEGSVTNSGRWMQWRFQCVNPPGDAKNDLWIANQIMRRVKGLYANSPSDDDKLPEAVAAVTWGYGGDPDPKVVAKEVNGYNLTTGKLAASFGALAFDGTTTSGNWLYCNSWVEEENLDAFETMHIDQMFPGPEYVGNRATRRWPEDVGNGGYDAMQGYKEVGLNNYWSWCWPVNRRIIYNRASVDLDGNPWDPDHPVIARVDGAWKGDVPDGGGAPVAQGGYYPFIMLSEGRARIFAKGLADGPLPEHYEPWESPTSNALSGQQNDPAFKIWGEDRNERGSSDDYPYVCTTYRLVEHWQAGQMTRNLPWLVETQPDAFVEISEELAASLGISNGDKVIVESKRGSVEVVAVVTKRFKPFTINGETVHQVGLPWHWGYTGLSTGDSANVLTPHVGDANTMIPEFKAFLVNVRKA